MRYLLQYIHHVFQYNQTCIEKYLTSNIKHKLLTLLEQTIIVPNVTLLATKGLYALCQSHDMLQLKLLTYYISKVNQLHSLVNAFGIYVKQLGTLICSNACNTNNGTSGSSGGTVNTGSAGAS